MTRRWNRRWTFLLVFALAGISLGAVYNTGSTTDLYVDCANGADSAPSLSNLFTPACTDSAHPCLTPQFAVNQLPKLTNRQTTVHLLGPTDGGTYTCYADYAADAGAQATLELDGFTVDLDSNPQAGLTVDCGVSSMISPVTATSFTAGTSTSPPLLTVSGAAWTPSAYKGMFVRVLSGTGAGNTYVIVDNTATQLTVLSGATTLDSTTNFDIIQSSAVLSDALAATPGTHATTSIVSFRADNGGDVVTTSGAGGTIVLSHCTLLGHSSTYAVAIGASQGVRIANVNALGSVHAVADGNAGAPSTLAPSFAGAYVYRDYLSGTCGVAWMSVGSYYARETAISASYGELFSGVGSESQYCYLATTVAGYVEIGQVAGSSLAVQNDWNNATGSFSVIISDAAGRGGRSSVLLNPLYSYGTPTGLASVGSGSSVMFSSTTATTAPNFISLDNGATYITKATIEAGTNKTIFNTSTGALAKEQ